MAPRRNISSDLNNSQRPTKTSSPTTKRTTVTSRVWTNSPTGLPKNSPNSREPDNWLRNKELQSQSSRPMPMMLLPTILIGEIEVPSPVLRIKANAVHAGLSPPLVLLKVPGLLRPDNSSVSLNNNWLIALPSTTVAMVDGQPKPWTTSSVTNWKKRELTHITLPKVAVPTTLVPEELDSPHTASSKPKVTGLLPVLPMDNQSQSSSRLTKVSSNHTEVELSVLTLAAAPTWTTLFSWLATTTVLGSSRTHGLQAGERADTSDSKELVTVLEPAVSNCPLLLPSNE